MKTLSKWRHYVWCISLLLCLGTLTLWMASSYLTHPMQVRLSASTGFDFEDSWVGISFRGNFDRYPLWPVAAMLGIIPLFFLAISSRTERVSSIASIVAGSAAGFLFAASLRVWPLLYADIGREGPLWDVTRLPFPSLGRYTFPLCGTAAFIALGEIGTRRLVIRIRHNLALGQLGKCPTCGYFLTGNTSGVCPECGIAPSKLGRGG
jgi:hypothetical protein